MKGLKMKTLFHNRSVKSLIRFFLFLSLFWWVFTHLTYLFRNTNWDKLSIPIFRTEEEQTVDVAFIGGSNVYRYWNPLQAFREQGIVSYDYAPSSMPAATTILAIQDIYETQSPKLFVVDIRKFLSIHWDTAINGGFRNIIDAQDINLKRLIAIEYYRKLHDISVKEALSEYMDIIYYHNNTEALANELNWELSDNRMEPELTELYFENGFSPNVAHLFLDKYHIDDYPVECIATLENDVEKSFRDLLEYCHENDVPILLILSPFAMEEESAREINAFRKIAKEYNVAFLDMNHCYDEMGIDFHTDFYDTEHVNILGARKYTGFLASYLADHYDLPDHRGETKFEEWNQEYKEYCEYENSSKSRLLKVINDKEQVIMNEKKMRVSQDSFEWFFYADNDSIALLILRNEPLCYEPSPESEMILNIFGLNKEILAADPAYIGYYSGGSKFASTSEKVYKGVLDNMWGTRDDVEYMISADDPPQITVNGMDYYDNSYNGGVHIVALDKNTGDVTDSVVVDITQTGDLRIYHGNLPE